MSGGGGEGEERMEETQFELKETTDESPTNQKSGSDVKPMTKMQELKLGFNIVNSTLGAGILTLPWGLKSSGMIFGVISLFVLSVLSFYTCKLILDLVIKKKIKSYKKIGQKIFKSKFLGEFFEFLIFLNMFGTCSGYVVIVGDYSSSIVRSIVGLFIDGGIGKLDNELALFFVSPTFTSLVVIVFLILPLSLFKKLKFLSYTSFLGLIAVAFVIILIACSFFSLGITPLEKINLLPMEFSPFAVSIPLFCFSYSNHIPFMNLIQDYPKDGLDKNRVTYVIFVCYVMITILNYIVAILGYLLFADRTKDNILMSFGENDVVAEIGKGCVLLALCCVYPIYCFALRASAIHLLKAFKKIVVGSWNKVVKRKKSPKKESEKNNEDTTRILIQKGNLTNKRDNFGKEFLGFLLHIFLTCCVIFLTYLVGISVPFVSIVLGFTSSIFYTTLNYLVPLIATIKIDKRLWTRIINLILFFIFLVIAILGTIGSTIEFIEEQFFDVII